jgi:16S rRNA (cytidine1402-2'-O)-methyltransferase
MTSSDLPPAARSTPFAAAQAAASQVAGHQTYPAGALYVVATPIGNLADITLRSLYLLGLADTIACEDTRHTGQLLHAYGLHKPLMALHEHNESEAAQGVIAKLRTGERVAYVSDAGTPAVSDPGSRLVALVAEAGLRVVPLVGASSVTAVLSVAGCVAADTSRGSQIAGFVFAGFLPTKGAERLEAFKQLATEPRAVVLLEAPHRIETLFKDLAELANTPAFSARKVTVGRELTKQFESVVTLPASDLPAWLAAKPDNARGEFAIVVHPLPKTENTDAADDIGGKMVSMPCKALLERLLAHMPLKAAVALVCETSTLPKNNVYALALEIKNQQ